MSSKLHVFYAVIIALLAAGMFAMLWERALVDDSYIPLRYVQNLLAGHGLVFNPGEPPVEGFSNPLMVLLLALAGYAGTPLLPSAIALSLLSYAGLIVLTCIYTQRRYHSAALTLVALLCAGTAQGMVQWAGSAMETTLFALLITWLAIATMQAMTGNRPLMPRSTGGYALLLVLVCLARPEGPLFAGLSLLWVGAAHLRKGEWRFTLLAAILSGSALLLCLLLRYSYYGDILPNTYYAKLDGIALGAQLQLGWTYLWGFLKAPPFVLIFLLLLAPLMLCRGALDIKYLYCLLLAYLAYVVAAGGDWMSGYRFIVPVVGIMALLMVAALHFIRTPLRLALPALLFLHSAQVPYYAYRIGNTDINHDYVWRPIAAHIAEEWPEGSLIAINMAGYIPYYTPQHHYLDMLGLNDRHIARTPTTTDPAILAQTHFLPSGHKKGDGRYVLEKKPDYIIFGGGLKNSPSTTPLYVSEHELLALPEFHETYAETVIPMQMFTKRGDEYLSYFVYYRRIGAP